MEDNRRRRAHGIAAQAAGAHAQPPDPPAGFVGQGRLDDLLWNRNGYVQASVKLVLAIAEVVLAVYNHYELTGDTAFLASYHDLVVKALDYIINTWQNEVTGLIPGTMNNYADATITVPALECGAQICEILHDAPNAMKFRRAALRAAIQLQGLSYDAPNAINSAFDWFCVLKNRAAWDEYISRWYESVWAQYTGSGGCRNNAGGSYAAGENSELCRSIFWDMQEARDLMRGMYGWAYVNSTVYGTGGFIDTQNRWVPSGYSDRVIWSQTEPAIYLTSDFRDWGIEISEPFHIWPLMLGSQQKVSARVQEQRGAGIRSVQINYGTGWKDMTANGFTYTHSWTPTLEGWVNYQVRVTDMQSNTKTVSSAFQVVTDADAADTSPPVISNLMISPDDESATVTWTISKNASTIVEYGLDQRYAHMASNPALAGNHGILILDLIPGATYYYRVRSRDWAGNESVSAPHTFIAQKGSGISLWRLY
ncbi:MAG: hypothetical protein NTY46_06300 [Candidatus Sumerlaeota bacterium]|nr:hypothetical protein [Candidatus Sumerlaeota bacterium]